MSLKKMGQGGLLLGLMLSALSGWAINFSDVETKAEKGDLVAMLQAGILLVNGEQKPSRPGQTLDFLQPLAEKGEVEAQLWLGKAYRDGLAGVSKDSKKGFGYLVKAAGREGNNQEAQFELGRSYYEGTGADRNLIAAYLWTSLSLEEPSSNVEQQAREQQALLTDLLTKPQLEKAKELVGKIKSVYLQ